VTNSDSVDSTASILKEKKYGIEFNPVGLLVGIANPGAIGARWYLSGGISLFAVSAHSEIAFPWTVAMGRNSHDIPLTIIKIDAAYRHYFGEQQFGLYGTGGIRYGYASGEKYIASNLRDPTGVKSVHHKFGVYVGIGYRHFWKSGWFWGVNLVVGHYVGNFPHRSGEPDLDDGPILMDAEALKIGYAF
jgi:hypothetical protein